MNNGNPGLRPRGPPNGIVAGPGRPPQTPRNISSPGGVSVPNTPGPAMSRAEKFEDEKRRIIESCFSKRDEADGSIVESYITHIRIVEDAAYPSSPPPAQSPETNKKPRVIVVAVRKTGRVRMHKLRENATGTFSIGKTWQLDHLTAIKSYTNSIPTNNEEQQEKQRAGGLGFLVEIQKPYYWQAATSKEKDFFIFSLIKIYKKYTGGNLPELLGFDHQEIETFQAVSGPPSGQPRPARAEAPRMEANSSSQEVPAQRAVPPEQSSQQPSRQYPQPVTHSYPPEMQQPGRTPPNRAENRPRPSPAQERPFQGPPSFDRPAQERPIRANDSEERMRQIPGAFPSSENVRNITPQTSQPQLRKQRSESPAISALRNGTPPQQDPAILNPAVNPGTDPSRGVQPYRVLHSASATQEQMRQNGSYPYGSAPDNHATPTGSRTELIPPSLRSGGPPSSRPSQESLQDRGRPFAVDTKGASSVPASSRSRTSNEISRPPTATDRSREASQEQWRGGRDDLQDVPQAPTSKPASVQDSFSGRDRREEDARPSTAAKASPPDINPPSTTTEKSESDTAIVTPSTAVMPTPPETPTESHRPGLGPMIKTKKSNKEIANTFRKAATAYNAFKPRAGGAAEKLREQQTSPTGEPDGITSVVPAPSLLKGASQGKLNEIRSPPPDQKQLEDSFSDREVPTVKVDSPPPKPAMLVETRPPAPEPQTGSEEKIPTKEQPGDQEKSQDEHRRKRKSDHSAKYAKALGVDPSILAGRTFDFESQLNDFGWGEDPNERCAFEELQLNMRRELSRAETGGWLSAIEQNDDRIAAMGAMMDRVIDECDELDGLLTLYGVELSTLNEDVAYIEAQSQGLQVQAANQKLLHAELKSLLDTISISALELRTLKEASLTKSPGIQAVERTLCQLYNAMLTIDPKAHQNKTPPQSSEGDPGPQMNSGNLGNSELSSMRAVREKKDGYQRETKDFVHRFKQYMAIKFREIETDILDELENNRKVSMSKNPPRLDYLLRDKPRKGLWSYSPLMLFAREMEPYEWEDIIRMYEGSARKGFQEEFRDNVFAWKRIAQKPTADEQDVLFTSQEKESESLVGRKLTVKRSKTVRTDGINRVSSGGKPKDGKVDAYEAFQGALNEMARVVFAEQNFVVDLFHLTSLNNTDFIDAVNAAKPEARMGGDPLEKKIFDPDRDLARRLSSTMEEIFTFWPNDLQTLVEWVVKQDALQGVGVIAALESKLSELEETNQEYLTQTMTKAHDRLVVVFNRFVDEQVHGIEETKVKIKKRKGVIAFMKIFPNFSLTIEGMLPPVTQLPIRNLVNDAYIKINKAMFESLKFIAKETPTAAQAAPSGGDPEDKEALNYHILLIENMNHYIEEVYPKGNPVLFDWKNRAQDEMAEHMAHYLAAVLRRPLGKLLDFLESAETQLAALPASSQPTEIATRASHSRSVFKKILSSYDAKEMRKGIDTLRKRIEKHFGEADEAGISRGLVANVLSECENRYLEVGTRTRTVVREIYDGGVEVEWRDEDVVAAFGGHRR